ncbi:MAG: ribosome silencing factor [Alphaproteobacteria bacterium]|nr:ribosome silencing factor [Alphaproteobacteria bacterium]
MVKKNVSKDVAEQILDIITESLDDGKANDVVVMDLQGKTSIANYMVVASGTSQRHVAALAEQIQMKLKTSGFKATVEGEEKADWVLIDAFDVIVHIFKPEVREFYSIEKMWSSVANIRLVAK